MHHPLLTSKMDHTIETRRPGFALIRRTIFVIKWIVPFQQTTEENWKKIVKRNKYLDLARKLKRKLWNLKVTVSPIIIGAFGTVTKWLVQGLECLEIGERVETIKATALLRSTRILRRVLEKTSCHSNSSGRPSAKAGMKNSQRSNNNPRSFKLQHY